VLILLFGGGFDFQLSDVTWMN